MTKTEKKYQQELEDKELAIFQKIVDKHLPPLLRKRKLYKTKKRTNAFVDFLLEEYIFWLFNIWAVLELALEEERIGKNPLSPPSIRKKYFEKIKQLKKSKVKVVIAKEKFKRKHFLEVDRLLLRGYRNEKAYQEIADKYGFNWESFSKQYRGRHANKIIVLERNSPSTQRKRASL